LSNPYIAWRKAFVFIEQLFHLLTEQDFLTQLEDVGILSLTPSRMVLGARIASHDDRYGICIVVRWF